MTPRRQMLIAVLAGVFVTILFFFFALRPKMAQIQEVRDQIDAARQEQVSLNGELERLREARQQRPEAIARLARLGDFLPGDPDLPGFIRLVQTAATASGVDLRSIAPTAPQASEEGEGIQVVPVTLTTIGGFHRLEDFLIRLENLKRLVEVRSITITPQPIPLSDQVTLNASIALEMYVVQPEARLGGTVSTARPSPGPAAEES